jgi:hypothetical protein
MGIATAEPDLPEDEFEIDVNSPEGAVYQIGMLLMLTQSAENAILTSLRLLFNDRIVDISELSAPDRRTLGMLLRSLREAADMAPEFDQVLRDFLLQRNLLAHELSLQPWFDLSTETGRDAIWKWIKEYYGNLNDVLMVFTSYNMMFLKQLGADKTPEWAQMEANNFIKYIEEGYLSQLPNLVRKKP